MAHVEGPALSDDAWAGLSGAFYRFHMDRPWLSYAIGRVVFRADARPYYRSMAAIREVPEGGTVVDAPVGHGVALRAVAPGQRLRYVGVDLSPRMLGVARERAAGIDGLDAEMVEGDATALPLDDGIADLFLSYWGLHLFDAPARAIAEAARVLRPGGRLVGSCSTRAGAVPGVAALRGWLDEAGFAGVELQTSGPMAYFSAEAARTGA